MSVFILKTSKLEANREILHCGLCIILYTRGEGVEGVDRGRGEVANHVTALIWYFLSLLLAD
jgi:hypothetical protein